MPDQATRKRTGADELLRRALPIIEARARTLGELESRSSGVSCAQYGQAERDHLNLAKEIKDWLGIL